MQIQKKTVRDAREPMFLYVDMQDVKSASRKEPGMCAAANAITRQCGAKQALVHLGYIYVEYPREWVRYRTPKDLRTQIVGFDRGTKFESGIYRLQAPGGVQKLGAKHAPKRRRAKTAKRQLKVRVAKARIPTSGVRKMAARGKSFAHMSA